MRRLSLYLYLAHSSRATMGSRGRRYSLPLQSRGVVVVQSSPLLLRLSLIRRRSPLETVSPSLLHHFVSLSKLTSSAGESRAAVILAYFNCLRNSRKAIYIDEIVRYARADD